MSHFLEIRPYSRKPGSQIEFHRLFIEEAMPLLQGWNINAVAYGLSLHNENSYYLMRRYKSLAQPEESESAFYGSDEPRKAPREGILACIENYAELVIELDDASLQGLRKRTP